MKELINFKGLNCFNNSVLTLANENGIDYCQCFFNLWSESEFECNTALNVYNSKRLYQNLEKMGLFVEKILKDQKEKFENCLLSLDNDELFIISMDSFYIPWNDIYKLRHDCHYFVVQNTVGDNFSCFDPTYNVFDRKISKKDVLANTFEICKIETKQPYKSLNMDLKKQISLIQSNNKFLKKIIKEKIQYANENDISLHHKTSRYIDCLTNNRLMFKQFLSAKYSKNTNIENFMPENYFLSWQAVKNGLNKLSISKNDSLSKQIIILVEKLLTKDSSYASIIDNL